MVKLSWYRMCDAAGTTRSSSNCCNKQEKETEKEINRLVIECYLESEPAKRGLGGKMRRFSGKKLMFEISEQRLAD